MNILFTKKTFIIFALIILLFNIFLVADYFKLNSELKNISFQKKNMTSISCL
jgi:hypothetical protein